MTDLFVYLNITIRNEWLPPLVFNFLGFFAQHLNFLHEKFQVYGTSQFFWPQMPKQIYSFI